MIREMILQAEIQHYEKKTGGISVDEIILVPKTVPQNLFDSLQETAECQVFVRTKGARVLKQDTSRDKFSRNYISDLVSARQEMATSLLEVERYITYFDQVVEKVEQYLRMWMHFVNTLQSDRVDRYCLGRPWFIWSSAFDKVDEVIKFRKSDCLLYESLMVAITLSILYFNQGIYQQTLFRQELFKKEQRTRDIPLRKAHACFAAAFSVLRDVYIPTRRQFTKITECFPPNGVPYELTIGFQEFYRWALHAKMQEVLLAFDRVYIEDRQTRPRLGQRQSVEGYPQSKPTYTKARRYFYLHSCWQNCCRELIKGNRMGDGCTEWLDVCRIKKDLALYTAYDWMVEWYKTDAIHDITNETILRHLDPYQLKPTLYPFHKKFFTERKISTLQRLMHPKLPCLVDIRKLVVNYKFEYMDLKELLRENESNCLIFNDECVVVLSEHVWNVPFFKTIHKDGRARKISPLHSSFYHPNMIPHRYVPAFNMGDRQRFQESIMGTFRDKETDIRTDYVVTGAAQ